MTNDTKCASIPDQLEDDAATMIVVPRADVEEMIAVVAEQRTEIDRLNVLIYHQVNSIDRAVRNVEEAISSIEEATRGLMILRKPQVNTLTARTEALLARLAVTHD